MPDDPQEQGAPASQDPQTPPEPVAPPVATPTPVAPGPWSSDLEQTFQDAQVRADVDAFLRSKVQPHTTKLEQQVASLKDAERLYQDLSTNPIDTYVAITNEMFGEQAAQQLLADIQKLQEQEAQPQAPGEQAAPDPRLAWVEQKQQEEYYNSELARVKADHPEINDEWIAPFVAAAQGDFDEAYQMYAAWLSQVQAGLAPQAPQETPPPVISGEGSGTTTPPVEPKKQSLNDAIEEFARDYNSTRQAPPTVGSV